ncbi:MAG: DUF6084 family protein [Chromatiales bacterium]
MPELNFQFEGVEVARYATAPLLLFKLRVRNVTPNDDIQNVALQCQIQIETVRRAYTPAEQEQLLELYGEPERWSSTLRNLLWTHANVTVPPFEKSCVVDVPVPCTYDFNVAAAKYFYGLEGGVVPLLTLFSGSIFYREESGGLQVSPISWNKEAGFQFPVKVWKDMMEHYYPNSAWLRVRKDAFDRLYQYKIRRGFPTWEEALESLLDAEEERVS